MLIRPDSRQSQIFPEGTDIVRGDLSDPLSIRNALDGIQKAFLLTNSSAQAEKLQSDFVDIAAGMGVKHIVKLSQLHARPDSPVRFLRYHAAVENRIEDSPMTYTFLRPNLFMQGLLGFRELIAHQGRFFAAVGDAGISLVDIRDIAAVAPSDSRLSFVAGRRSHRRLCTLRKGRSICGQFRSAGSVRTAGPGFYKFCTGLCTGLFLKACTPRTQSMQDGHQRIYIATRIVQGKGRTHG